MSSRKRTGLLISVWLLFAAGNISAQSGRSPSPTPSPTIAPLSQPTAKTAAPVVPDQHAPKYKLILSRTPGISNFIAELNQAGEQGYRFDSAMFEWPVYSAGEYRGPATLLKLDEGKYEFAFFEIGTGSFYGASGFEAKYDVFAKRGFRLVDHFRVAGGCDLIDSENSASGMRCDITYLFLLERLVGAGPVEFVVAGDTSKPRGIPGASIATEMNTRQAEGLFPVSIISRMQVLLEKIAPDDQLADGEPQFELVSARTGRLNDLGKLGYRVALLFDERALMYRRSPNDPPRRYSMIDAKNSDLQEKLLTLQQRGAVYRAIYRDDHLSGDKLVFEEQVATEPKARHAYKVLRIEFAGDYSGVVELSPAGREAMKTFTALTAEGFRVRTLYRTHKDFTIGIFLER